MLDFCDFTTKVWFVLCLSGSRDYRCCQEADDMSEQGQNDDGLLVMVNIADTAGN